MPPTCTNDTLITEYCDGGSTCSSTGTYIITNIHGCDARLNGDPNAIASESKLHSIL